MPTSWWIQRASAHPDCARCQLDGGQAFMRRRDLEGAEACFRRASTLDPTLAAAWLGRARLYARARRWPQARYCLIRHRLAGGTHRLVPCPTPRVLRSSGSIRVLEDADLRALFIGEQCQGAMVLEAEGPGPWAVGPTATGWLVVAAMHPRGQGLMLGLGAGAGVVTLLENLPELRLVVVERDATLIELALECFPRLAGFVRQGRLEVIQGGAVEVLTGPAAAGSAVDFAIVDLYDGSAAPPALLGHRAAVQALVERSPTILLNAIGTPGSRAWSAWSSALQALPPIVAMVPTAAASRWASQPHNWMLSTVPLCPVAGFSPFAGSEHIAAQTIRSEYRWMLENLVVPGDAPARVPPHDGHGGIYARVSR